MQRTTQIVTGYGTYYFDKTERYYKVKVKRGIMSKEVYKVLVRHINQRQFNNLKKIPEFENFQSELNKYFNIQNIAKKKEKPVIIKKCKDYEIRKIEEPKKKSLLRRIIDWLRGKK